MSTGIITTFYSYKGGVGRSMALSNIACILSNWGYKVLCIDGDLEAPGLHYYFKSEKKEKEMKGFLDILLGFQNDEPIKWKDVIKPYRIKSNNTIIHLMYASRSDKNYTHRLKKLDWENLYSKHNFGYKIEELCDEWRHSYDHILIDSRTGITDIGSVLTIQIPDQILLFCTPNYQGLNGLSQIAEKIIAARSHLPLDKPQLTILPIVTSFAGRFEKDLGILWINKFINKLDFLYRNWLHANISINEIVNQTKIPYIPKWSFGEELPVLTENNKDVDNISYSLTNIASLLGHRFIDNNILIKAREEYIKTAIKISLKEVNRIKDFFISYAEADKAWAEWIAWQLEQAGYSIIIQAWDFLPGGEFTMDIHNALKTCRKVIAVLTPDYMKSNWCLKESLTSLAGDISGENNKLIPVRVLSCKPKGLLNTRIYIDLVDFKNAEQTKEVFLAKIKETISIRRKPETEPVFPATASAPGFPGLVPEIWNIPLRNPHFTGRNKEISRLHTFLHDENTTILTQAIVGLGGIGKTQLALEYAHRYKSNYCLIWWIHAGYPSTLETDYRDLVKKLGFDDKGRYSYKRNYLHDL